MSDFLLLRVVGALARFKPFRAQALIVRIVALVLLDAAQEHFGYVGADGVEKIAVVRDDDDRALIRLEIFFKPLQAGEIEVVRRLVEHEHVGLLQEQTAQTQPRLLAARKQRGVLFPLRARKSKARQHARNG